MDNFSVLYHREGDMIRIDGFIPRNDINTNGKYVNRNNLYDDVCNKANSLLDDMSMMNDELKNIMLPRKYKWQRL